MKKNQLFYFLLASLTLYFSYVSVNACSNIYGRIVNQGPKNEKVIALTFDDGPHPKFTNEILDILKEYDIKATFFVLGKFAETYPEIIIRQWEEGHEIGNHTYSHVDAKSVSKKILYEEYKKTQEIIENLVNNRPKLFRPPYGSFDSQALDIMEMDNSIMILWSSHQDSKDWSNPKVDEIVNTTLSNIKNGDIILFHDYVYYNKSNTVEALKIIIPELIDRGYKFVTISELLNLID
ncbi:polysaccharide deacetylase family protein [Tepidimicrobium xylanilyticum]|uniref:polysaccharide deacetylase family protein n=1 Tax=Tepidimicrobium xylanilyticum TaxID=1123352 RepID=UPI0026564E37|nr:polysaccharide deacetylase family protein [Tepidimicrobium xylanilyticum]GMG97687.1 oligosaccharide deacetylase [Tepidimicrobium xylanilyticum]